MFFNGFNVGAMDSSKDELKDFSAFEINIKDDCLTKLGKEIKYGDFLFVKKSL